MTNCYLSGVNTRIFSKSKATVGKRPFNELVIPVYSMKIWLDIAGGKEGSFNIIFTAYVAPCYLVSLCERFEEPAASFFKAEYLKSEDIFF
jgi:hypothetical protein